MRLPESTVSRNMDIEGNFDEDSEGKNCCRESFHVLGEYILNHEQNIGRHMDIKVDFGGVSHGNEEQVIKTGLVIIEKAILVINCQELD